MERRRLYIEDADPRKAKLDRKTLIEHKNPTERRESSFNAGMNSKYQSKKQESYLNKGTHKNKANY